MDVNEAPQYYWQDRNMCLCLVGKRSPLHAGQCVPDWRCTSVRSLLRGAPCWRDTAQLKMENTRALQVYMVKKNISWYWGRSDVFYCLHDSLTQSLTCVPSVYHALYLEELTAAELIRKIASVCDVPLGRIHQVYRQGPTGIHILLSDQVYAYKYTSNHIRIVY